MGERWYFPTRVVAALVLSLVLAGGRAHSEAAGELEVAVAASKPTSSEAYVTLVYGDDFVLGARVLGQSLRESGTTRCAVWVQFPRMYACKSSPRPTDGPEYI